MPNVWIPPLMRSLSGNRDQLAVPGATLREVVTNLEKECPGIQERLFQNGKIKPGIAIAIDGVVHTKGLGTPVDANSEIHFVPAISGGQAATWSEWCLPAAPTQDCSLAVSSGSTCTCSIIQ